MWTGGPRGTALLERITCNESFKVEPMTTVAEVAVKWHQAGVSTIPIVKGGSKRPAVRWAEYQARIPELGEIDRWWGNGHDYGLAIICGAISGNLEMVELEARANTGSTLLAIDAAMAAAGLEDLWVALTVERFAYMEVSPSGGMHLLYRIMDHEVPGNTKIANDANGLVMAETRGEGGYVIVAPTSGICHPSGQPWTLAVGEYGEIPNITWDEREALLGVLKDVLDETPERPASLVVAPPTSPVIGAPGGAGLSPGDDFEASTDWTEILEPHGWTLESRHGAERNWTRPGKDRREGASATTGYKGDRDRLYVFSTSTVFDAERPYTKFGAFALLNHHGDHSAAAKELVRQGFGSQVPVFPTFSTEIDNIDEVQPIDEPHYTHDEVGNSHRLWAAAKGNFHWVTEAKSYYTWTGQVWEDDYTFGLNRTMVRVTDEMLRHHDDDVQKWGKQSRSERRINAACSMMKMLPGVAKRVNDFDADPNLINTPSGVLNVQSGVRTDHDSKYLLTQQTGAAHNVDAAAPKFQAFLEQALPDLQMREYVQRAVGYSLLGKPDQRSIFMIHGPTATGKSTFLNIISKVLGSYAGTAPAGTFKASRNGDKGPTNDLHSLRGKRFVTTSETSDSAAFDEDLLKRITGNDSLTSRALYKEHVEWIPRCSIWLATNYPPRFNSDDDAIWQRAKLIPFTTQIARDDMIANLTEQILAEESSGVLNWILEGARMYQQSGMAEPDMIVEAARAHRESTDSALRFIDEKVDESVLLPQGQIDTGRLHQMYRNWATEHRERGLGYKRFVDRIMSSGRGYEQQGRFIVGISHHPGAGIVGHIQPHLVE